MRGGRRAQRVLRHPPPAADSHQPSPRSPSRDAASCSRADARRVGAPARAPLARRRRRRRWPSRRPLRAGRGRFAPPPPAAASRRAGHRSRCGRCARDAVAVTLLPQRAQRELQERQRHVAAEHALDHLVDDARRELQVHQRRRALDGRRQLVVASAAMPSSSGASSARRAVLLVGASSASSARMTLCRCTNLRRKPRAAAPRRHPHRPPQPRRPAASGTSPRSRAAHRGCP